MRTHTAYRSLGWIAMVLALSALWVAPSFSKTTTKPRTRPTAPSSVPKATAGKQRTPPPKPSTGTRPSPTSAVPKPPGTSVPRPVVRLIDERGVESRSCSAERSVRYRACLQVAHCNASRADTRQRATLASATGRAANVRLANSCNKAGCGAAELGSLQSKLSCASDTQLCLDYRLPFQCGGAQRKPSGAQPKQTSTSREKPRAPKPTDQGSDLPSGSDSASEVVLTLPEDLGLDPNDDTVPDDEVLTADLPDGSDDPVDELASAPGIACLEPPDAPSLTADVDEKPTAPLALDNSTLTTSAGGVELEFGRHNNSIKAKDPTSCEGFAWQRFYSEGTVHPSMPEFNMPQILCTDDPYCQATRVAWMRTHHNVWVARSILHHIAAQEHEEQRIFLWSRSGASKTGASLGERYTLEFWFGPYDSERFGAIKGAIDKLWEVITTNKTGGINVKLRCPGPEAVANVCYTSNKHPSAQHWIRGQVDLCRNFFNSGSGTDWGRANTVTHELLHHLWTWLGSKAVAIQDTHYHGHGLGCGTDPETTQQYGESRVRHLATYRNTNGNNCGHLRRNLANNDTYSLFITTMGDAVYSGKMHRWPKPTQPTPQPPQCTDAVNCLCSKEKSWLDLRNYFEPDGDGGPDRWCADEEEREVTCQSRSFGASQYPICTDCDVVRGAGCACDEQRECDQGFCYGADTFGQGGVGRCYSADPPAWACLADCKRLFNDDNAWCYSKYPTGQAHCMDINCSMPVAAACADQGKVCRDGDCVVECDSHADCAERGYPSTYKCQQHVCEYMP